MLSFAGREVVVSRSSPMFREGDDWAKTYPRLRIVLLARQALWA